MKRKILCKFISSLRKLHSSIRNAAHEDKTWFSDLENSNWLFHIRVEIETAFIVLLFFFCRRF
jgi:hypothetical protein